MLREKILKLIQLYNRQVSSFDKMRALTQQQCCLYSKTNFTEDNDLQALTRFFVKRQKQITVIEACQEEINEINRYLPEKFVPGEINSEQLARRYSFPEILELQKAVEKAGLIIKEIFVFDTRLRSFCEENLKLVQQKIKKTQAEKKLLRVYNHVKQQREGFFIDHSK